MFVFDNVKLATRNFQTRKLRSALTVLGISIGISTILVLVSLGYGLQKVLIEKITASDALLTLDVSSPDTSVVKIDDNMLKNISAGGHIDQISPLKNTIIQAQTNGFISNIPSYAVQESYSHLSGITLAGGEWFKTNNDAGVLLSSASTKLLGFGNPTDAIGREINLTIIKSDTDKINPLNDGDQTTYQLDKSFVVTGIITDDTNSFSYIPMGWLDDKGFDFYASAKIKVANQSFIETTSAEIIKLGLFVSSLSDTVDQANKIFTIVQIVLAVFGIVALVVSAIGMFNTMTIALLERTVEIGIMKSLGASNQEIKLLFLTESILIGTLGGVGGVVIGLGLCKLLNAGLNLMAKSFGGTTVNVFYTPSWFILFILAFSTIIGFSTGIYPAQRAARLNALAALRYK